MVSTGVEPATFDLIASRSQRRWREKRISVGKSLAVSRVNRTPTNNEIERWDLPQHYSSPLFRLPATAKQKDNDQ